MTKEQEIAAWMLLTFEAYGRLTQSSAVRHIRSQYGEQYVHKNKNRNYAINKEVLAEFRRITKDVDIVWSRSQQTWRRRRQGDPAGRMVK